MKKIIFILILMTGCTLQAAPKEKRLALVKNSKVENIAVSKGDVSWEAAMKKAGYKIIDVTGKHVSPGDTCSKCNGNDFKSEKK